MKTENIRMLEIIAGGLRHKLDEVVFVGGSVMELYVNDASIKPRVTNDVDIVIEIATRAGYDKFESELRDIGFINDLDGHACRLIYNNVKVDVITTGQSIQGFTNKWYEKGFGSAFYADVDKIKIKIFPVEYYLASKLVAYKSRGANDPRSSHDLEDIIYVIDGNNSIDWLFRNSDTEVKEYLRNKFRNLAENSNIREIVNGHLGFGSFEERINRIIEILKFAEV